MDEVDLKDIICEYLDGNFEISNTNVIDTSTESTRDVHAVLRRDPSKRFKNTLCQYQLSFLQIYKVNKVDGFYSVGTQREHNHNHPINSLEAMSF